MPAHLAPTHIIVEPNPGGHRFFYVELLLRAAIAAGFRPQLLTTRGARQSTEYAVHLEQLLDRDDLILVEDGDQRSPLGSLRVRRQVLRRISRLCTENPDAHIVIPELIHYLIPWAVRRDRKRLARRCVALLMRPSPEPSTALRFLMRRQYSLRQTSVSIVRGFILKRLHADGLTVFDLLSAFGESLDADAGGDASISDSIRVDGHLRDPSAAAVTGWASSRSEARAALGLPEHEAIVLVAGGIDRRKGFDLILAAFEQLRRDPDCPLLVVAGRVEPTFLHDPRVRDLQSTGRLWMRDQYISTPDFAAFLCSADALIIIRGRDERLSGILAQAAACGRVVVTVGPSAIAETVETHRLGLVAGVSPEALARGIEDAVTNRVSLEDALEPARKTQLDVEVRFAQALLGGPRWIG